MTPRLETPLIARPTARSLFTHSLGMFTLVWSCHITGNARAPPPVMHGKREERAEGGVKGGETDGC